MRAPASPGVTLASDEGQARHDARRARLRFRVEGRISRTPAEHACPRREGRVPWSVSAPGRTRTCDIRIISCCLGAGFGLVGPDKGRLARLREGHHCRVGDKFGTRFCRSRRGWRTSARASPRAPLRSYQSRIQMPSIANIFSRRGVDDRRRPHRAESAALIRNLLQFARFCGYVHSWSPPFRAMLRPARRDATGDTGSASATEMTP